MFNDKTDYYKKVDVNFKHDDVVYKLGECLKIKTVSHEDVSLTDFSKFQEYIDKVKGFYPSGSGKFLSCFLIFPA